MLSSFVEGSQEKTYWTESLGHSLVSAPLRVYKRLPLSAWLLGNRELIRIHLSNMHVVWRRYWSQSWSLIREYCSVVSTFNSYGLPLGLSTKSSLNPFEMMVLRWRREQKLHQHMIKTSQTQGRRWVRLTQVLYHTLKECIMAEDFDDDSVDHVWFCSHTSPSRLFTSMCGAPLLTEIPFPVYWISYSLYFMSSSLLVYSLILLKHIL